MGNKQHPSFLFSVSDCRERSDKRTTTTNTQTEVATAIKSPGYRRGGEHHPTVPTSPHSFLVGCSSTLHDSREGKASQAKRAAIAPKKKRNVGPLTLLFLRPQPLPHLGTPHSSTAMPYTPESTQTQWRGSKCNITPKQTPYEKKKKQERS